MFSSSFDWIERLKPSGSQGSCGSCYAFSTIRMIEARINILYNENVLNLIKKGLFVCAARIRLLYLQPGMQRRLPLPYDEVRKGKQIHTREM